LNLAGTRTDKWREPSPTGSATMFPDIPGYGNICIT
jgi:hypothetical protein